MKYIHSLVIALAFVFCSCGHDDEPKTEIDYPIVENYVPATIALDINDKDAKDKIKGWANRQITVNSLSELPEDPLGFSDAYKNINFKDYTLLITYNLHDWSIDTYGNRYYQDVEGALNWTISVGTSSNLDNDSNQYYFTRYAILVKKLPKNRNVTIWFSLKSLDWNWNN